MEEMLGWGYQLLASGYFLNDWLIDGLYGSMNVSNRAN